MSDGDGLGRIEVEAEADLRDWLAEHGSLTGSRWLVTFKKGDERYLPYDRIVRVLIAHGWVDSQPRSLDASRSMRLISPRRPGSNWSKANRERAEDLINKAEMAPQGRRAVEAAKQDGSWTALVDIEAGVIPDDLAGMLRSIPGAKRELRRVPPIIQTADPRMDRRRENRRDAPEAPAGDGGQGRSNERANRYRR